MFCFFQEPEIYLIILSVMLTIVIIILSSFLCSFVSKPVGNSIDMEKVRSLTPTGTTHAKSVFVKTLCMQALG